jgi:integrase
MKLTARSVRDIKLSKGKTDELFWDDEIPGLGLRLRAGGSRNWVFQYAIGKKQRRLSLGSATQESFRTIKETDENGSDKIIKLGIRDQAAQLHARVKLSQDPAGEKQQARKSATDTFEEVAKRFLAFQKTHGGKDSKGLRQSSYDEAERHLTKHAKTLHRLLLEKIQQRDIASVISAVRVMHPVTANRVRTSLSSLFSWAISEGLITTNPVTGTKRTDEKSRDRVLDALELRVIWNSLEDDHYGSIIKLLALTGQRASEIAGMRWSELVDDAPVLPPERTKNHREHLIPLSEPARTIIAAQPRRADHDGNLRELVFGFGQGAFSGWGNSKEALDKRIAEKTGHALPHWTPHDLRRSFATHASGLGIQPHIIEVILNHVSGFRAGVAGIYNRHAYDAEKRTALALWADHLIAIVEKRESNVTPLKRAR